MKFSDSVTAIKGVGESRAEGFRSLGVSTVGELLRFYPRTYEDWSRVTGFANCVTGENACVRATVLYPVNNERVRGGMLIARTAVSDGESVAQVVFFNNKYIPSMLKSGEEYLFYGKVTLGRMGEREMISPLFIKPSQSVEIRPIYHQNKKINSRAVQSAVSFALENVGEIKDYLPDSIIKRYSLISLDEAIRAIHFPKNSEQLQQARDRLVFDELFILQLSLLTLKSENAAAATNNIVTDDCSARFAASLPFELTGAQKRAVSEAVADMKSGRQMNRLLQGDVGSGKTAVAASLVYTAAKNKMQSAVMAPTELLAVQHYDTFSKLFENSGIRCALLTGSTKASDKKKIKEQLKNGEIDFVAGTHALIQDDVKFRRLGLVITDEQHRFGVKQRTGLCQKGDNPHVYVMSATPIPRTLALILFGDLSVSVLDELPPGRQKTKTYAIGSAQRGAMFDFIRRSLDSGYQAYIVCPLVEDSESAGGLQSAQEYYKKASAAFSGYRLGLLHGKMTAAQKDEIMAKFKAGEIQLLVATVVIEVGVDVPNAVVMAVENAERFGLSQLHQLRGRVGRGSVQSACILVSDAKGEEAAARMRIMCSTADGFKIADEDLKLRGPGDFFGTRQHGLPRLRIADFITDTNMIMKTQKLAAEIIKSDRRFEKEENRKIGVQVYRKIRSLQVVNTANTI